MRPYDRDPAAILAASLALVRAEANLARFPPDIAEIAVRVIQACGMVEVADRLAFSPDVSARAVDALRTGAPVYADSPTVASGIARNLLPEGARVLCVAADPSVAARAAKAAITPSAAAVDLWDTGGAICAIGEDPTALFRLMERIDEGAPPPAAILAFPVGFVGAAEAKAELAERPRAPFLALRGRKGGSAMASAAVNALALLAAGGMQ
ncbi:precorrin-8X methylmutase [Jannaschia aquimarina]|uniref:CobH protein n=1 Tax=Jannaschia aquimarina TaxID=935700 RepID=A0A0D1D5X3_9RHOB|nr:precorrin-8X methylmutase [Jannaschia aquimarina]KIT15363.1 Precorrin-8X methylmutase [Jannaschia aquimarina]SNS52125.1 precorrin-8X methylmutase [Jannaschia aquimarina]